MIFGCLGDCRCNRRKRIRHSDKNTSDDVDTKVTVDQFCEVKAETRFTRSLTLFSATFGAWRTSLQGVECGRVQPYTVSEGREKRTLSHVRESTESNIQPISQTHRIEPPNMYKGRQTSIYLKFISSGIHPSHRLPLMCIGHTLLCCSKTDYTLLCCSKTDYTLLCCSKTDYTLLCCSKTDYTLLCCSKTDYTLLCCSKTDYTLLCCSQTDYPQL